MSAKPTVTLTLAGDSAKLEQAMSRVGSAAGTMSNKVGSASNEMQNAGRSAESLAEKSDTVDTRAMGFSDTIAGVSDGLKALSDDSMSTSEKMMALGMATSDVASGFTNFLIPMAAQAGTALKTGLGGAMSFVAAHPLMFALLALAAIFILLWMNSETFRDKVMAVFNVVAKFTKETLGAAWDWVVDKTLGFVNFYLSLPGRILGVFNSISDGIKNAFKAAFNFVADVWNRGIGQLSFTVPGWVPGIGGNTFSAPRIPKFHTGGVVPGMAGTEVLAILQAGERVSPRGTGGGGGTTLRFAGDLDSALASAIMELFRSGRITLETE